MPDWSDSTADSSWHSQMQTNCTLASDTLAGESEDKVFKYNLRLFFLYCSVQHSTDNRFFWDKCPEITSFRWYLQTDKLVKENFDAFLEVVKAQVSYLLRRSTNRVQSGDKSGCKAFNSNINNKTKVMWWKRHLVNFLNSKKKQHFLHKPVISQWIFMTLSI